ncbi:MAG: HEAT repeat domain-containing protein [Elainella sp. C42_A2020_010]|nr:HEAT repeat domain-containing protein [Elainella sp. C42_A2020_010]
MVHRFKLLLVAACLSLELWGLRETASVQASPAQPSPASTGSVQSSSIPAKAKVNAQANPPANKASSAPASPGSASRTKPVANPAANPAANSAANSASPEPASTPTPATNAANSSGTNQLGWVMLALLLTGGGVAVGRRSWQRRSFDPARQAGSKTNSLAPAVQILDPTSSNPANPATDQTNILPKAVQPNNSPSESQISDISVSAPQTADMSISSTQSDIQSDIHAADSISVTPTTRLAKVDIVQALIADLHHSDVAKRRKAIWELGQRGDSRAIQPLVDLLVDADSQQRSLILAAIAEISTRALKPMNRALLISLQDESADVRKNAIRDMTRIYDLITQVSQLVQYAASDTDAEVQETARWALGQLNRLRALPELEQATHSTNSAGELNRRDADSLSPRSPGLEDKS